MKATAIKTKVNKPKSKSEFKHDMQNEHTTMCPCCSKVYNVAYKRPLTQAMVNGLRILSQSRNSRQIHPSSVGDFAKLRYFGLIEPNQFVGSWRITKEGNLFLSGKLSVPAFVNVINNTPISASTKMVSIYHFD